MAERQVWKYPVEAGLGTENWVEMPRGAEVIEVGTQADKVFIWVVVDPEAGREVRCFGWFASGAPLPDGWRHVGTAQILGERPMMGSVFVWHVFEGPQLAEAGDMSTSDGLGGR